MLGERSAAERVAVEVVDGDDLVVVDEPSREGRADEPRTARDDDALPGQCHAASLLRDDFVSAPSERCDEDARDKTGDREHGKCLALR